MSSSWYNKGLEGDEGMMSQEKREMVVAARERGNTVREISKVVGVSQRSIYKLLKQVRETGDCAAKLSTRGRKARLDADGLKRLDELIQSEPDITLSEMQERISVALSISQLDRIVRIKLGYSFKKRWCTPANESGKRCSSVGLPGRRRCPQ